MSLLDNDEMTLEPAFFNSQTLQFSGSTKLLDDMAQNHRPLPPLVELNSVDYRPPAPIVTMTVSNNIVILALKNNHIIRINLEQPDHVDDIQLAMKSSDTVHKLFLDTSGQHLLIALASADCMYLHGASQKAKILSKLKGHLIEAVTFNRNRENHSVGGSYSSNVSGTSNPQSVKFFRSNTSPTFTSSGNSSSCELLVGTFEGQIYECEIEPIEARFFQGKEDKYFRLVHTVPDEEPITGLLLSKFPNSSTKMSTANSPNPSPTDSPQDGIKGSEQKYLLVVTTHTRMYEFVGYKSMDSPVWRRLFSGCEGGGGVGLGLGLRLGGGAMASAASSHSPFVTSASEQLQLLQQQDHKGRKQTQSTSPAYDKSTDTSRSQSLEGLAVEVKTNGHNYGQSLCTSPDASSTSGTPSFSRKSRNKNVASSFAVYSKYENVPSSLAWLSTKGIYLSALVFGSQIMGESVCDGDSGLLLDKQKRVPTERRNTAANDNAISSHQNALANHSCIALTEFHVIQLGFDNRLTLYCVLDKQLVYNQTHPADTYGRLVGLTRDTVKETLWVYGPDGIHEILFNDETRGVWRIYLERDQYETALHYSKTKPEIVNYILGRQANYYYSLRRYTMAAQCYAKTSSVSLEEVALKFIDIGEYDALQVYVNKRLESLKPDQKAQATMLTMWLIEMYLSQLDDCVDRGEYEMDLVAQLRKFLTQPTVKQNLSANHTAVYNLICSHGRIDDGVFYANHMGDYERVVSHHIACNDYTSALAVLALQSNLLLYYNFSSQLLMNAPELTVDAWLAQPKLDPRRLIPAIAIYTKQYPDIPLEDNQVLRYLENVVTVLGVRDSAIQNYLISIYVSYSADDRLLDFLQTSTGYDRQYVLRLCFESNKLRACVDIYKQMGLYEEAVTQALKVDVALAKEITLIPPEDDESLRKKLWLKIARHVIEEDRNIERAMELLEEQNDLVRIEDILPFFPEFVKIDHFKDSIIKSLVEYNRHIVDLKENMNEATKSATLIRKDIKEIRNKYGMVMGDDRCCSCDHIALVRQFYLFPCGHVFHVECLYNEVEPHIAPAVQTRIAQLQQLIQEESMPDTKNRGSDQRNEDVMVVVPQIDKYKNELDDIIAGECVLCGSLMVRSLDEPFIDDDELDDVLASWTI
eukprot:CFRG2706T1